MENDCEYISRFIMRRLQGKLTEEETRILEEWMRAGKERRKMLDELSDLSELKKYIRLYGSFDELKGWEKVRKACWRRSIGERFGYLKIAMIVLLCLGGCLFFLTQQFRIRENKQVLSLTEVRPGMNQALLILENGKEVYLQGSGLERDSLYGEGWKVEDEGKLCYEQEPSLAHTEERWHILRVPKGGEYSLLLGDGTFVQLNSESELKYPIHFGQQFRKVILSGEAYFRVTSDSTKVFVVETDKMEVRVFGTSFDVMAYRNESAFYTTLVEGRVELAGKGGVEERLVLKPGCQAVYQHGKFKQKEVNTDLYTAWTQGRFAFKSEELEKVLRRLERWYNVEFKIVDESIRQKRFTGNISRYGDITRILEMLELTTAIRFEISGNKIVVEKS